ncbi:MAG: 50S ribosomal protein L6 [Thermodesulfovibrio sp.]|nr:50S ribosomal protein L6 [Thermodesulfovibrio sp.]MCX7725098.1 50S ribosomal protein L6 [Thermodesulfovibrio sp.]MDW7972695.1 50S ribosomal protein L6 [Thermodesulfovibrio sp.]
MSRIGRKPIKIPENVNVTVENRQVIVKGPKGQLSYVLPEGIDVNIDNKTIFVTRQSNLSKYKALHGLARSLISNMVVGVSEGFTKSLQIHGVGYRAQLSGNKIILNVGYSHPVEFVLPEGIKATVDEKQTTITLSGIDKQLLGQVAANLRAIRPPDPYKGKGIRYSDEVLKLKPGKTGKK